MIHDIQKSMVVEVEVRKTPSYQRDSTTPIAYSRRKGDWRVPESAREEESRRAGDEFIADVVRMRV